MKFWVLAKFTYPRGFPLGEGVFYSAMFHGEVYRAGRTERRYSDIPVYDPYRVEVLLRHPAELLRNAYAIPPVFKPTGELILSQRTRDAIGEHENLHYSPVSFRHLFWIPWQFGKADPDLLRNVLQSSPWDAAFKKRKHRPDLVDAVGPYYELVIYRNRDVPLTFADARPVSIHHPTESDLRRPIDVYLSETILQAYPLLWTFNGTIVRHDFFERLRPWLDWHFFAAEEYAI